MIAIGKAAMTIQVLAQEQCRRHDVSKSLHPTRPGIQRQEKRKQQRSEKKKYKTQRPCPGQRPCELCNFSWQVRMFFPRYPRNERLDAGSQRAVKKICHERESEQRREIDKKQHRIRPMQARGCQCHACEQTCKALSRGRYERAGHQANDANRQRSMPAGGRRHIRCSQSEPQQAQTPQMNVGGRNAGLV